MPVIPMRWDTLPTGYSVHVPRLDAYAVIIIHAVVLYFNRVCMNASSPQLSDRFVHFVAGDLFPFRLSLKIKRFKVSYLFVQHP